MGTMTLSDWSSIAQVIIAIFTALGVLASLYVSTKALREVQSDRHQRQKPHLAFGRGGYRYPIAFVKCGKSIPGVNPKAAERLLPELPSDAESVRLLRKKNEDGSITRMRVGRLKNYGLGPALSTHVTWIPKEIWVGKERFEINQRKLSEPIYSPSLNTMPSVPAHILPGEEAGLSRLPTFIEKDVEKKLTRVRGVVAIQTRDVFDKTTRFEQEFTIFTGYGQEKPWFHVTFGDLLPNISKSAQQTAQP